MNIEKKKVQVLKGAQVIDATGADPIKNGVIVIEGDKITQLGSEAEVTVPQGAEIVDLSRYTLMPGLMDIHLHLSAHNVMTFNNYRIAQMEVTPQQQMLYAMLHAQMLFEMGFTTLRDHPWPTMFAGHNAVELIAIREAFSKGIFVGPRMIVGGFCTMTGSHLDLVAPRTARRDSDATADGPWELRKLARQHLRAGVDFIKTCASGGGGTDQEAPDVRNMTQEELDAIVDEAHSVHKHCACHCFTPTAQKMALKAGADTIDHCVFTDDEAIQMLVDTGKPIVPTLLHRSDRAINVRKKTGTSEFTINKMRHLQPITEETFKRYIKAGVKIAMGTDMALDPEMGANSMELEIYVKFGMSPMEAILTATKNTAEAIWINEITGTLEPGKYADIIAVDGNPLKDITVLQEKEKIAVVMKEGRIWVDRRPGMPRKGVICDPEWRWKRLY